LNVKAYLEVRPAFVIPIWSVRAGIAWQRLEQDVPALPIGLIHHLLFPSRRRHAVSQAGHQLLGQYRFYRRV